MLTFIWFFLALSLLILVHEFGHYIMAKAFKVYVYEFSIFMGPLLYQRQIGETKYSIRLLPIGGYCSMAGELDMQANEQEQIELPKERTMAGINRFKQFLIAFAGPFFNIVLAFLLMIVFFLGTGVQTNDGRVEIIENGLAYEAGLRSDMKIDSISSTVFEGSSTTIKSSGNDSEVTSYDEIVEVLNHFNELKDLENGDTQVIKIMSEGKEYTITRVFSDVTYKDEVLTNVEPKLGLGINVDSVNFIEATSLSFNANVTMGKLIFEAVGNLFTKEGFNNVSGIVGMYNAAEQFGQAGFYYIIYFVAMISINLGIMNLLPFPALDGGRILILLGESITRKKLPTKVENFINNLGFIFLLGLIIAVTIKDIFFATMLFSLI
ncbi:MAG: M50 family metallopeptidase [Bacilli bacterium]|nr:M50 family metallopeptidase [Bacilli bacterium]